MTRISACLVTAALFILALCPLAQAFELSMVGAANYTKPALEINGASSAGYSSKLALGGGLLLGFDLGTWTELEIGALYVGRHYTYPAPSSGQQEDSFYSYEVPVVLRLVPIRYLTFGGGVYCAVPTGLDTYTLTPAGATGTSSTSDAIDSFKPDFGVLASVAIKIPLGIAMSFLVDGRYYHGLTNASKLTGEDLKFRDTQVLFGLNFGF